jgi:peptidoglycan/xylan/chitin deacetylase (PgdA/CDA1 family)
MTMNRFGYALVLLVFVAGCVADVEEEENLNDAYSELLNSDGSADSSRCSGVVVPDQGPFGNRVAMTFDDGPSMGNTRRVMDILESHGARGTFFINGRAVAGSAQEELMREVVSRGHIIGNHTQNHKDSRTLSASSFRSEMEQTDEIIRAQGISPTFMRFPYGSANCTTADIAREMGYSAVGWHIDTGDWCYANSRGGVGYCDPATFEYVPDAYRNDIVAWSVHQARQNGGGVLLMHDVHTWSVNHLEALMTGLENAGFSFVGLDDASVFPALNGTEGPRTWIGTPCAEHETCNFFTTAGQGSCTSADPELPGFCTSICEGPCPDRYGFAPTFCVESSSPGVGLCVAQSDESNGYCADIPGTEAIMMPRFVGNSGSSAREAIVCVPAQ